MRVTWRKGKAERRDRRGSVRRLVLKTCLGLLLVCPFGSLAGADQPPSSPLLAAVRRGDVDSVRALVGHGIDVNAPDGQGMTALHYAAYRGDTAMTEVLLKAGARAAARDADGISPLEAAAFDGRTEVARLLILSGAAVNASDRTGLTALHVAAAGGHEELVRLLLASGADWSLRSAKGHTAAEMAAQAHFDSCAAMLEAAKASAQKKKASTADGRPEPPRQARIVITDDNLPHAETDDSISSVPPGPVPASGGGAADGPTSSSTGVARGGQPGGESVPREQAPMDPQARAAEARRIQARRAELMARIPKLREDCQNHQRFNQALDSNQPIPADLKNMADEYGSGSASRDYEGKVDASELKEAQWQSRRQANRNRADTDAACNGLKRAEEELRDLDLELARLP
jgi:hypothetical protein